MAKGKAGIHFNDRCALPIGLRRQLGKEREVAVGGDGLNMGDYRSGHGGNRAQIRVVIMPLYLKQALADGGNGYDLTM